MITTVCMNPSFDKTAELDSLQLGGLNRLERYRIDPGGKGINVALVLKRLGGEVQCLACLGADNQSDFLRLLEKEGLELHAFSVKGMVRTNLKIVDRKTQSLTEINENGPVLTEEDRKRFIELLAEETARSDYVVFSGSLPGGCHADLYAECMKAVGDRKCVLDASGTALRCGLKEEPYFIKPNLAELEDMTHSNLKTLPAIREAALRLISDGAQNVAVSMGKDGALLVQPHQAYYAPAIPVEVHSTVGAGDCMVGGMLSALDAGADLPEAFRYGMAAATASVMTEGTQLIRIQDYEALIPKVSLQKL